MIRICLLKGIFAEFPSLSDNIHGLCNGYKYLELQDTPVAVHIHDRNMAINKLVKDRQREGHAPTVNQNDSWHGYKSLRKICREYQLGQNTKWAFHGTHNWKAKWSQYWHMQIIWYGTVEGMQKSSELVCSCSIPEHYSNNHQKCSRESRLLCESIESVDEGHQGVCLIQTCWRLCPGKRQLHCWKFQQCNEYIPGQAQKFHWWPVPSEITACSDLPGYPKFKTGGFRCCHLPTWSSAKDRHKLAQVADPVPSALWL